MWSVWSDTVDVYLGQGLAMLKAPKAETVVLQLPPTLPLERVLARLADSLPPVDATDKKTKTSAARRRKLRVSLSAALCPAVAYAAPPEVKRWEERQHIATATAAQALGLGPEQLRCEIALLRPGLAAALPAALLSEIEQWASRHQLQLVSVRPLWARATQCAAARKPQIQGLLLQEPDAWTLLADSAQGAPQATTWAVSSDPGAMQAALRRGLVSAQLDEDKLLKLCFTPQRHTRMPGGPAQWAPHWSRP